MLFSLCSRVVPRWFALSLCTLLLALTLPGQARAWYPEPLDLPAVPSTENRFAFVEVDATGTVHTVWVHGTDDLTLYYMRGVLTSDGTAVTWEENQALIEEVDANSNPRLVVDTSGTVLLVYGAGKDVFALQNEQRGAAGGWSAPELVAATIQGFHSLALTLDINGIPYVAWCEGVGAENPSVVSYSYRTAPGIWETPVIASEPTYLVDKLRILTTTISGITTLHMVYTIRTWEFANPVVGYSRGQPGGEFSYQNLSSRFEQQYGDDPALALDEATGTLWLACTRSHGERNRGFYESYSMLFTSSVDDGVNWNEEYATIRSDKTTWPGQVSMLAHDNIIYLVNVQKVLHGTSILDNGIYYQRIMTGSGEPVSSVPQHIGAGTAGSNPYLAAGPNALVAVWIDSNVIKYNVEPLATNIGPGDDPITVVGTVYLPVVMQ